MYVMECVENKVQIERKHLTVIDNFSTGQKGNAKYSSLMFYFFKY